MKMVLSYAKINGFFIGADHCLIFSTALKNIGQRIEHMSSNAFLLANYMENKKEINRVMYPLLKSHPTFEFAKKYFKFSSNNSNNSNNTNNSNNSNQIENYVGPSIILFHIIPSNKI